MRISRSIRKYIGFLLTGAVAVFLITGTVRAEAPAVLILESPDSSQSPLSQALYLDVISRISDQVEQAGFKALRADNGGANDTSKSEAEENAALIARAKEGKDGQVIAYAAIVRLFADMVLLNEGTQIRLGIEGRLLDITKGDVLARFDLKLPENYQAPPSCDRRCLIQMLQSNAAGIADSLGQILGQRLSKRQESVSD